MNLGNTASAVMDKLCGCCCANWCERLRHTDSATSIVPRVKTPSQSDTRWKRLSSGRRANTSPPSPLGSAELIRVQPGLDPYYSDDDASTSSEGSAKVPDGTVPMKRAASMRRPRPDEQFANPNEESRKRSSSMSGASPSSTLTVPSPIDSRRRRSFENFRMCDLGEIRPELYVMEDAQSSLDKTQSPSKDDANEEAYGILSFSVRYEESTQRLYLHLQSIEDLPSKGHRENVSYDPVVLSCLLPDCKHVQKSKSAKASLNPVFDDTVVFPLDRTKSAENVAVRISVYESDELCTNGACTTSAIGHVLLPVVDCLTPTDNPREFRRRVGRRSTITGNLGRLLISLAYLPSLERLSCVILRAKDVRCEKGTNVSSLETYVKVTLMCGVDKVKSRKTAIIRGTDSPVYTESLCFVVPMSYIDETSLVIQLTQHAQLKKDRILGQVILGPYIYTQGSAISHWGKMLARREAAKQWHNLYI